MKIHTATEASPVAKKQVCAAVNALKEVLSKTMDEAQQNIMKPKFLLRVNMHKVTVKKNKTVLIHLPNPIFSKNTTEICVFTKDLTKKSEIEETEDFFANFFQEHALVTPKIIALDSLNKNYKSHEQRLKLCRSYDLFLADDRIVRLLPNRLGTKFYKKRKFPLSLQLTGEGFAARFQNILESTKWLVTGNGSCSQLTVANYEHTVEEITNNIVDVLSVVAQTCERGWANIRSIDVKTESSIAVPIYRNEVVAESLSELSKAEQVYLEKLQKNRKEVDVLGNPIYRGATKRYITSKRFEQKKRKMDSEEDDEGSIDLSEFEEEFKDDDEEEEEEEAVEEEEEEKEEWVFNSPADKKW